MSDSWRALRAMDRWSLVRYLAMVGAVAGLLAWLLVYGMALISEMDRPSTLALLLAIPRAALYGVIIALILRWYWDRHPAPRED